MDILDLVNKEDPGFEGWVGHSRAAVHLSSHATTSHTYCRKVHWCLVKGYHLNCSASCFVTKHSQWTVKHCTKGDNKVCMNKIQLHQNNRIK